MLKNFKFKYVVFYHGINDTRTNNCPPEVFDNDYRHVSFYNELFVLFRHPEIKITLVPWFVDFAFQKFLEKTNIRKVIPKEYNVMEFYFQKTAREDSGWKFGDNLKSKKTFTKNLENILTLANQKGDSVLVVSYASFMPEGYSLKKFIDKQLDYTEHKWPAELYGAPANVVAGIRAHNKIGLELSRKYNNSIHVEFSENLPKEGKYFFDICHLTPEGCEELGKMLRPVLIP